MHTPRFAKHRHARAPKRAIHDNNRSRFRPQWLAGRSRDLTAVILLAAVALYATGCQEGQNAASLAATPSRSISGDDIVSLTAIARNLNLSVNDTTDSYVTLGNSANTVRIFTHSRGLVFVNGRSIGRVGQIEKKGDMLFFSKPLQTRLRASLNPLILESPAPETTRRQRSGTIVIDPGHGGKDPGAISPTNRLHEKQVNLNVARMVTRNLRRLGYRVIMTRDEDYFVELNERAAIANRAFADVFVSIHADANNDPSIHGYSAYVAREASPASHVLAEHILTTMQDTGLDNKGLRKANFRVLVRTHCPAVLVELAFLSNPTDARLLAKDEFQTRLAKAVTEGIDRFFQ